MENTYQAVKIEGSEVVHIIDSGRYIMCGVSTWRPPIGGVNRFKCTDIVITEVTDFPTCPKCASACLYNLNEVKRDNSANRVISEAFAQIFGRSVCQKGKCDELHKEIVKANHNYPYIPNNCHSIASNLDRAYCYITKKRNDGLDLRFLDAGCGIGNIVALAAATGFTAHGIELNSGYLKIARRLTASMREKPYFKCADIITFDRYHLYDLIYYYVPIADITLQTAFEIHLIRNMKVGAFMLPTGSSKGACEAESEGYFKRYNFDNNSSRPIFEKVKEVPKDWVPKRGYLRKGYEAYVASIEKKKGSKDRKK